MSVSSVSSNVGSSYHSQLSGLFKQRRQDFKAIESAVQSGNLASAQQALAAFQNDQQTIQSARSASGAQGQGTPPQSQFQTDLAALTTAIQSGDLTSAQTALSTLEQDRQAHKGSDSGQGRETFKTDLQTLLQAVQAGDLTSAQQSVTALQADMKTFGMGHHHHHHYYGSANPVGDVGGNTQVSTSSVAATSSVTTPNNTTDTSTDSSSAYQNLLSNILNAVAAYTTTLNQTPSSLLNLQA